MSRAQPAMAVMLLLSILCLAKERELPLSRVGQPLDRDAAACAALGEDGSVLATGGKRLFHWNADGSLRHTIPLEQEIMYCATWGGDYLVTPRQMSAPSQLIDAKGKPLQVREPLPRVLALTRLEDQLYVTDGSLARLRQTPYAFMVESCSPQPQPGGWTLRRDGLGFAKANDRQRELFMRFARVMVVRQGQPGKDLLAVMNELENRVYLYSPEVIARERIEGQRSASKVPFVTLDLPEYSAPPHAYFELGRVTPRDEDFAEQARRWRNSLGLIRRFDACREGYQVAYEVPIYAGKTCTGFKIALVVLGPDFKRLGKPRWLDGIPLGPARDGAYRVLQLLAQPGSAQVLVLEP